MRIALDRTANSIRTAATSVASRASRTIHLLNDARRAAREGLKQAGRAMGLVAQPPQQLHYNATDASSDSASDFDLPTISDSPSESEQLSRSSEVSELLDFSKLEFAHHLSLDDILEPDKLDELTLNKDYVLLVHQPASRAKEAIQKHGLKSTKCLAEEDPLSSHHGKYLMRAQVHAMGICNDPELIYFRPNLDQNRIRKGSIVIAARMQSVYVFDQENRVRERASKLTYMASGMKVDKYFSAIKACPEQHFLNRYKEYSQECVAQHELMYIPECCVKADKIDPRLFVAC